MMCYELCKFSLNDDMFLKYKPSEIAAASCILSINIFKKEEIDSQNGKQGKQPFLEDCKEKSGMFYLNTRIWNNHRVVSITGYTIEMIK